MANKQDLYTKVAELVQAEVNKKDQKEVVEATLKAIQELTLQDGKVQLIGFGNFEVRDRAARKGFNPKMLKELKEQGLSEEEAKKKAEITIEASKSVGFKPSKAFKESVN